MARSWWRRLNEWGGLREPRWAVAFRRWTNEHPWYYAAADGGILSSVIFLSGRWKLGVVIVVGTVVAATLDSLHRRRNRQSKP